MAGTRTQTTLMTHPGDLDDTGSPSAPPWSRLAELTLVSFQSQTSLARQSAGLAWATVAGDLSRSSVGRAYVVSLAREGVRFWRTVGELGIDVVAALAALGRDVAAAVLQETAEAGRRPPPEASDRDPGGRWLELSLAGPVGGRAEGSVKVANKHPRPRRILFSASDLMDSSGSLIATAPSFTPTAVTVPSGKARTVKLGIELDPAMFLPGERYSCMVEVSGGDRAMIAVALAVQD